IDAYADNTVLDIVKRLYINVTIITKKDNLLTEQDILKYNKQYNNLKVIYDNSFHDRYFIIDKRIVYHCGASINRIGYKTFSITQVSDEEVCKVLVDKVDKLRKR
ncbi:MAG: ORF6N domain-containing protein, partial [Bacilli bacterium]|nr:ORF6N domain-containing protein [Bacilli bacterium]